MHQALARTRYPSQAQARRLSIPPERATSHERNYMDRFLDYLAGDGIRIVWAFEAMIVISVWVWLGVR
jgi:hypothetical protein